MHKAVQLGLVAAMFACFSVGPRAALAQISGPWPPQFGAYFWQGNNRGDGDGNTGVWNNWDGRWQIDSPPPPVVITTLAAQDGDTLILDDTFVNDEDRHSVSFGGHALPSSSMQVHLNAAYSGGSLAFNSLLFQNSSNVHGPLAPYPIDVSGTTIDVDSLQVTALSDAITFNNVSVGAGTMDLSGGAIFNQPGAPTIAFNEATIAAPVLDVHVGSGGFFVNIDSSTLQLLGLNVGVEPAAADQHVELNLSGGTTATIDQFVIVGTDGEAQLALSGGSKLQADNAYVNVGEIGPGFMHVSSTSTAKMHEWNIGVFAEGSASIDTSGLVTSDKGTVGVLAGQQGTVNVESLGMWHTEELNVGQSGIGYVFVRDRGVLKVDGAAILGHNAGSRGVLNLIGADSKLELGATGSLAIGDEGAGELHLTKGATFSSAGAVSLGKVANSSGTVTVADANSKWTVTGELTVGDQSHGAVEITDHGTVSASGATLSLGKQAGGGDGTLLLDGDGSTLDFSGSIIVGDAGKGTLQLKNGATLTTDDLTLGKAAGSEGVVELQTSGANQFGLVTDDLTIGEAGRGKVTVEGGYGLTTHGEVVMGKESTSGTQAMPNTATITGSQSQWVVEGNITVGKASNSYATVEVTELGALFSNGTFFTLGDEANSHGLLRVGSSVENPEWDVQIDELLRVGVHGTGRVIVENAGDLRAKSASLGIENGGNGRISVYGSKATASFSEKVDVGGLGEGRIELHEGGRFVIAGEFSALGLTIDSAPNVTTAAVVVEGYDPDAESNDSLLASPLIKVGDANRGELTSSNHGRITTPKLQVALQSQSHGTVTTTGGFITTLEMEAGLGGDAEIKVLGVGNLFTKKLTLGAIAETGSADVVVNDSELRADEIKAFNKSAITVSGGGTLSLSDGRFQMGGSVAHPATLNVTETSSELRANFGKGGMFEPGVLGRAIVNVSAGGLIKIPDIAIGAASGSVLAGSQLNVTGAGSLVNANALIVHRGATLTAAGAGQVVVADSANVNGTVDVLGGSMLVGDVPASGVIQSGALTLTPGGILSGSGVIKGNFIAKNKNSFPNVTGARIKLGNSPGRLTVEGNATLEPSSVLELEVGGLAPATQYDVLDVQGAAQLDGTVLLKFIDGFAPVTGDQFSFVSAGTLSLAPNVVVRNLAAGWQYSVAQVGGAWTVTSLNNGVFVQDGDFNEDGHIDGGDLTAWKNGFGLLENATHGQGDADADFDVDAADLLIWQRQFGSVPAVVGGHVVPEPASMLLVVAACAGVCRLGARRRCDLAVDEESVNRLAR